LFVIKQPIDIYSALLWSAFSY